MSDRLPRVKCLLVDDRAENLLALSALLRSDDVEVLEARSGAAALDLLLSHHFALALVDVQMPDMDGFELAELMRGSERTRDVPIIFVTAGAQDRLRIFKGYESGAVDFLFKPIEPHILRNKAAVFFQLFRQQQQLARELHDRTERLRVNEMFTAVLGHDLRNPLNAILTGARLLELHSQEPAVRTTSTKMISSARRMSRMIDDLLDLARARLAGGIPLQRESAELGSLITRVVQEHRAIYPDRRIDMTVDGNLHGEWDTDRLAQVASNLIGNALRHGDRDQAVEIDLDGTSPAMVTFTVANAGVIDPALLPTIFDPFRGGQSAGRREGLGLGLYIVQQIMLAHQGCIDVESAHGRTTFRLSIPRAAHEVVRL